MQTSCWLVFIIVFSLVERDGFVAAAVYALFCMAREGPVACVSFCCQGAGLEGGHRAGGRVTRAGGGGGGGGSSWQRREHVADRVLAGYRPPSSPA